MKEILEKEDKRIETADPSFFEQEQEKKKYFQKNMFFLNQ